ncbi:MAG: pirin family protein [Rhodospirillales bacterium]
MKKTLGIYDAPRPHWVGDGFPVRSMFSYDNLAAHLSPFLMLDYAGPAEFTPATTPRGVGEHPHSGFETVTIVYSGEVAHRDSTGKGGIIGPGDVQWMTAGAGILHDEFHSEDFTRTGGLLEMVQLWVNLPARDKMAKPGYQPIVDKDIPAVDLPGGAGQVRVIAGEYDDGKGPATTFTPMHVWDLKLKAGKDIRFTLPDGWTTALVVMRGAISIGDEKAGEAQLVILDPEGEELAFRAEEDSAVLLLSGEPLNEPIVGYGPFVMNSREEIIEAINDFNSGKFGSMPA